MNLPQLRLTPLALLFSASLTSWSPAQNKAGIAELTEPVNLLKLGREAFVFHLNPATAEDAAETEEDVFKLDAEKGTLVISGRTWGYIRTASRYRDYHLTLDYRFTGPTSGSRAEKARDSGLLLHCFGKDGGFKENWMSCIETQIIEGSSGDFIVLGPFDSEEVLTPVYLESRGKKTDEYPIPVFDPEGEKFAFPTGIPLGNAIAANYRHEGWKQQKGIRHEGDLDHPVGEWNKIEVICKGDEITNILNGEVVNKGTKVSPTLGFIAIQSEGAEVEFREWVVKPVGE